jgi:hypothetical protein
LLQSRDLAGGDVAVALVNMDSSKRNGSVQIADLVCAGCARSGSAEDLWKDTTAKHTDTIEVAGIGPHEAVLLRFTPDVGARAATTSLLLEV